MKVYLAAPLFSQAERRWNQDFAAELRRVWPETTGLDQELEIILPQSFRVSETEDRFEGIVERCIQAIDACDGVITVLEGADADSGVAFEQGYAFARGKPIVGVRSDVRSNRAHGLNIMLDQTCRRYIYRRAFDDRLEPLARAAADALRAATGL
jgi:nucleoside 2-deoxyribosyltransferase